MPTLISGYMLIVSLDYSPFTVTKCYTTLEQAKDAQAVWSGPKTLGTSVIKYEVMK